MIKWILEIINSKRDLNGNCYWAFVAVETATGKQCVGSISGGESNILAARRYLPGVTEPSSNVRYSCAEMPIREFNRRVKGWPYAGCCPDAIAQFITENLTDA
jgi:hypothetical protein